MTRRTTWLRVTASLDARRTAVTSSRAAPRRRAAWYVEANWGTIIAVSTERMMTTIMISTSVKPRALHWPWLASSFDGVSPWPRATCAFNDE